MFMGVLLKNLGSSDVARSPEGKLIEIPECFTTLLARDYKGLSNYASNGVIEVIKLGDVKDG